MINNKLHINEVFQRCQVLKKKKIEIQVKEKEFLRECDIFSNKILTLDKSPWKITPQNKSIIDWCYDNNIRKLGQKQKELLKWLQKQYLKGLENNCGISCFAQYKYIGAILGCTEKQISNIVKSLENHKLIIRVYWLYKGHNRIAILPNIPQIYDFFKSQHPDLVNFCKRGVEPHELFQKTNNSNKLQMSLYLYTNIILFNNIININDIKEYTQLKETYKFFQNNQSLQTDEPELLNSIDSNSLDTNLLDQQLLDQQLLDTNPKEITMPIKFTIVNQTSPSKTLSTLTKNNIFAKNFKWDDLNIEDQNNIAVHLDYTYGLDVRKMYRISPDPRKYNQWYNQQVNQSRESLLWLLYKGYSLQFVYAMDVIKFWNTHIENYRKWWGKKLTKIQSIKEDPDTLTFQKNVIAITWILFKKYAGNKQSIFLAIDRLMGVKPNKAPFKKAINSKVTLEAYLQNFYNSKNVSALLDNDEMFLVDYYSDKDYRENIQKVYPIVKNAIVDTFKDKLKGDIYCRKNIDSIVTFINRITNSIFEKHVDTGGLKFFAHNEKIDRPPLIYLFIDFLEEQIRPKEHYRCGIIKSLNDPLNLELFADYVVRDELGVNNFWKENKILINGFNKRKEQLSAKYI